MQLNSSISAVITGGASGLGRATAQLLASHGVKVAIFDLQEDLGEALASEIGGVFCKVTDADGATPGEALVLRRRHSPANAPREPLTLHGRDHEPFDQPKDFVR